MFLLIESYVFLREIREIIFFIEPAYTKLSHLISSQCHAHFALFMIAEGLKKGFIVVGISYSVSGLFRAI